MFKFILKLVIVAAIIVGIITGIHSYTGKWPDPRLFISQTRTAIATRSLAPFYLSLKEVDIASAGSQLTSALDSLITHQNLNSPVVLGVKITNDSLNTFVDLIQKMPPDQVDQLKNIICAPATSSAN